MIPLFEKKLFNQKKTILFDTVVAAASFPLAFLLYKQTIDLNLLLGYESLSLVVFAFAVKFLTFFLLRISRAMWLFFSTPDLIQILKASSLSSTILFASVWMGEQANELYPILLFDWLLSNMMLAGSRLLYKKFKEQKKVGLDSKRTLIIGAGEAGDQLVRELNRNPNSGLEILGFLDDDPSILNRTVHGIRVLGAIQDIEKIARSKNIHTVLIAIPSASSSKIKHIAKACLHEGLEVKTLPTLRDIVDGKVYVTSLKPVNIEDLLGRAPIRLDEAKLASMIYDKVIFVTGGGGSIGSELCKQILHYKPRKLIIFEVCEYFIYRTEQNLNELFPDADIVATVGDVRDRPRIASSLESYRPDIVFHAAAYKHVPMMEHNPGEAIKTNIRGTKVVAEEVSRLGLDKFVLISTDKAVNPTNIMGATKRIAEMICEVQNKKGHTDFTILRFGNVLGSAGSVIPHFLKQIKAGKAIQITHPKITRYFMSIPEATQLVLQAGALGKGGEIFVLDMGEPVKILDLAKDLIRLSGLEPDIDIPIEFSGLRPGEKLYEELLANDENTLETDHEMVRVAKVRPVSSEFLLKLEALLCLDDDPVLIRRHLKDIVPEYDYKSFDKENDKSATIFTENQHPAHNTQMDLT